MRLSTALIPYRILLPLLFLAAFPSWIVKMLRRGGFGTRLHERAAIYSESNDFEPCGATHIHAVSVGESLLALKLIRSWLRHDPSARFVLATGTATGHMVATDAAIPQLRVTYAPLDFSSIVRRYLNRFEPARIVLIEGEAWPLLLRACQRRGIPISLVNARMSPRSARRYRRFAAWVQPVFALLDHVAIQERDDSAIWRDLGVPAERIHHSGSLKFDPGAGAHPTPRPEFQQMLDAFGKNRPVILAASTHPGEHAWIATAARSAAPHAIIAIAPRHAERRAAVQQELQRAGFSSTLRSQIHHRTDPQPHDVFVIDSTGELRDWTAHAAIVIIGKSFLSTGGQNPSEAILASKPVIFGPHMENFEPLTSHLVHAGGAIQATDSNSLVIAIQSALNPQCAHAMTRQASLTLAPHDGATERIIALISSTKTD